MTRPIDARPSPLATPTVHPSSEAPFGASHRIPSRAPEEGGFRAHLARAAAHLSQGEAQMASAMSEAMRGQGLDQAQLIALQSGVYRYSQEMELASRLVDRATQAVKQTLQSQQ